ncbi:hypothetical protein ACP4OV_023945 [Aristida adscensionis]
MEPSRRRAAPAADRLISLPEHLLDNILTRLPLLDAVRTSALARAWRRRWESLPALSLSFLDHLGTPSSIVDGVLIRYSGRISRFGLCVVPRIADRVDQWLIASSRRGVASIDLRSDVKYLHLHSSIFSCVHLVVLKLSRQLEAIIGGSPLLRVLKIDCLVIPDQRNVVINALNLCSLTITSWVGHGCAWRIAELPHLDNATFRLDSYAQEHGFREFLARAAHVRKLILKKFCAPHIGDILQETLPLVNLRSLFLCTHFCGRHAISSTFCLLRNAPALEELEIQIDDYDEEEEVEANAVFQYAQSTNGLCASLQAVKMTGIGGLPNEMRFIELILSKATVLRTMSVNLGRGSKMYSEKALSELNTYRRASPHAQVFFKGSGNTHWAVETTTDEESSFSE